MIDVRCRKTDPGEDMMSAFVWLDYSERERRKMLDVVDLFKEHDMRDDLGIGPHNCHPGLVASPETALTSRAIITGGPCARKIPGALMRIGG
jgi:hypothetical protein